MDCGGDERSKGRNGMDMARGGPDYPTSTMVARSIQAEMQVSRYFKAPGGLCPGVDSSSRMKAVV